MNSPRLFLAAVEHGLTPEKVREIRSNLGDWISELGFEVVDPTLGQEVATTPRDVLISNDRLLLESCNLVVAYMPFVSDGVVRELRWARSYGQLAIGFGEQGSVEPDGMAKLIDHWCSDRAELERTLRCYRQPPGEYFTSAYTNKVRGDVLIYGSELHQAAPGILANTIEGLSHPVQIYQFCCERSHVNELAQKLPTMLRLGVVRRVTVLTKDGSPHDVQMHTIVDEVVDNCSSPVSTRHLVVEHGKLCEVPRQAVRKSRHLSEIDTPIQLEASTGTALILTGAKSDEPKLREAGLFDLLEEFGVEYQFEVVSSDRDPERLRAICRGVPEELAVVLAFAGGVPNLPVAVKSWLPDIPVVGVPIEEEAALALVALTTPKDRPVLVPGFGRAGIRKAAFAARELCRLEWAKNKHRGRQLRFGVNLKRVAGENVE